MALLDWLNNMSPTAQANLAGASQGLMGLGAGLAAAGQWRPWNQPGPTVADAFAAYGTGQRAGMLNAYAQQKLGREQKMAGILAEASDPSRPAPLAPDQYGPNAPNTISPEAAAIRAAIPAGMLSVAGMMEPGQIAGLVAQRETQRQRPMTADELRAAGFRPGSVVMVNDFTGAPNVLQQPDTMSADAVRQRIQIAQASRAPQQPQAPVAVWKLDGSGPELVPPGQSYGRRPYTPSETRQPGPGTDAEAEVNLIRLAPAVASRMASPQQVMEYLAALNRTQQPRFDAATGQTITPTIPAFAPSVQDVARLYPNAIYPGAAGSPPGTPAASPAPEVQPAPQAPPAAAPVQPAPIPPGAVQGPTPGSVAEPPASRVLPGAGGVEGVRITPQAREAARKAEIEVGKVNDAAQNFLRVLRETGGTGVNTLLNNPRSPEAQRLLAAFENFKMTMRSESLLNTGVLQPGENGMINDMLLNPQTLRGAMATNESYAARVNEITNFVLQGYNRQRAAVGLPPLEQLPPAPSAGPPAPPAGAPAGRNPLGLTLPGAR